MIPILTAPDEEGKAALFHVHHLETFLFLIGEPRGTAPMEIEWEFRKMQASENLDWLEKTLARSQGFY